MKKKILLFIVILVITIGIIFGIKALTKPEYTKDDVLALISPEVTNNMCLKQTSTDFENGYDVIEEFYIKDNVAVQKSYSNNGSDCFSETIKDFDNNSIVSIDHTYKKISKYSISSDDTLFRDVNIALNFYKEILDKSNNYKYLGKENLDGVEVIKFAVDNDKIYFVDINSKHIVKVEGYDNDNMTLNLRFTYEYDNVSDSDILNFDINNYPDYTLEEF